MPTPAMQAFLAHQARAAALNGDADSPPPADPGGDANSSLQNSHIMPTYSQREANRAAYYALVTHFVGFVLAGSLVLALMLPTP